MNRQKNGCVVNMWVHEGNVNVKNKGGIRKQRRIGSSEDSCVNNKQINGGTSDTRIPEWVCPEALWQPTPRARRLRRLRWTLGERE